MSQTSIFKSISDFPNDTFCAFCPCRWFWGVHRYLESSNLWSGMPGYHFPTDEYWSPETKRSDTSYAGRETSPTVYSVPRANRDEKLLLRSKQHLYGALLNPINSVELLNLTFYWEVWTSWSLLTHNWLRTGFNHALYITISMGNEDPPPSRRSSDNHHSGRQNAS
jgi:hypothetical protein